MVAYVANAGPDFAKFDTAHLRSEENPIGRVGTSLRFAKPLPQACPRGEALRPRSGTGIDHIAFSFPDIGPVWERMMGSDVEIVRGIETSAELGFTSFFVRGPDGLLVEIVEARPIPEGLWR